MLPRERQHNSKLRAESICCIEYTLCLIGLVFDKLIESHVAELGNDLLAHSLITMTSYCMSNLMTKNYCKPVLILRVREDTRINNHFPARHAPCIRCFILNKM